MAARAWRLLAAGRRGVGVAARRRLPAGGLVALVVAPVVAPFVAAVVASFVAPVLAAVLARVLAGGQASMSCAGSIGSLRKRLPVAA